MTNVWTMSCQYCNARVEMIVFLFPNLHSFPRKLCGGTGVVSLGGVGDRHRRIFLRHPLPKPLFSHRRYFPSLVVSERA